MCSPIGWTFGGQGNRPLVTRLAYVVAAEGPGLLAVRERQPQVGQSRVAVLCYEAGHVEAPAPAARFADKPKVLAGNVGECERAIPRHGPGISTMTPDGLRAVTQNARARPGRARGSFRGQGRGRGPIPPIRVRTRVLDRCWTSWRCFQLSLLFYWRAQRGSNQCFRRKRGDPPDPGQHSVEIFLDDHTVNVRELLGDLDQRLA
jgi:hypothetical protein